MILMLHILILLAILISCLVLIISDYKVDFETIYLKSQRSSKRLSLEVNHLINKNRKYIIQNKLAAVIDIKKEIKSLNKTFERKKNDCEKKIRKKIMEL